MKPVQEALSNDPGLQYGKTYVAAFAGPDSDLVDVDNGGIFLDELGDASPNFHSTILRVLQSGDYLPLGSTKTIQIENVKIIAATSKADALREDLLDFLM